MAEREPPHGFPAREPERLFERTINPVQRLQFELMTLASFNGFDGSQVVHDLIQRRQLWRGAVMDRGYQVWNEDGEVINLTKLRDLEAGHWNVDTLFVLTSGRDDAELIRLAQQEWGAAEAGYVAEPDLGEYPHPKAKQVLRIWWE